GVDHLCFRRCFFAHLSLVRTASCPSRFGGRAAYEEGTVRSSLERRTSHLPCWCIGCEVSPVFALPAGSAAGAFVDGSSVGRSIFAMTSPGFFAPDASRVSSTVLPWSTGGSPLDIVPELPLPSGSRSPRSTGSPDCGTNQARKAFPSGLSGRPYA